MGALFGGLGGVWKVWRGKAASDKVTWYAVVMPHCFNAGEIFVGFRWGGVFTVKA